MSRICDTGLFLEKLRNASGPSFCSNTAPCRKAPAAGLSVFWESELREHRAACETCSLTIATPELSFCFRMELLIDWRNKTQRVVESLFAHLDDGTLRALDAGKARQAIQMLVFWERQLSAHTRACEQCGTLLFTVTADPE